MKKNRLWGSQNLAQGAAAAPGCMLWCRVQPHQLPELAKLWERPFVKALSEISLLLNTGNSFKHIKKKSKPNKTALQAGFQAGEIRLRTLEGQAQAGWDFCLWELDGVARE